MLVITRKPGQSFTIGENVEVHVIRIGHNGVRIGIEAPCDMAILRDDTIKTEPQHGELHDEETR